MGLNQAVLKEFDSSGNTNIMTKEEVDMLLKHGAYKIFREDMNG
jgi:hypothetical protein